MATAYTIRYGSANTDLGPWPCTPVSKLSVLDEELDASAGTGGGGGSMTDGAGEGSERGSGSDGMGSSEDEVSMVMFFVTGGDCRKV